MGIWCYGGREGALKELVRLAAAEEPAVAERAAERELGGLELLHGRLADRRPRR